MTRLCESPPTHISISDLNTHPLLQIANCLHCEGLRKWENKLVDPSLASSNVVATAI